MWGGGRVEVSMTNLISRVKKTIIIQHNLKYLEFNCAVSEIITLAIQPYSEANVGFHSLIS